ncbi:MAG: YaaL family protein [Clostridiales bacterium]|nr:YaaL family protein [Clostridiales bacterium]
MGFFRNATSEDSYSILLNDIRKTTAELESTYINLENVVDPDLIDYYIYQAKAVQMRYQFLLHCAKKIDSSVKSAHITK